GELKPTYVGVTKKVPVLRVPSREQAVVMNFIETYTLAGYAKSLATLIGARNITHVSRISNNRVCIYLANKDLVDNLLQHNSIFINIDEINIRRLISPAKRIVISNVCPSITNDNIEDALNL
ncbi:hypothetical protein HHI36_004874, partial [Cryptolaemus montrouzieri]